MNTQGTPARAGSPRNENDFGADLGLASILVVDDEPGMRNFLVKILAPRCKRVEQATNVNEASEALDNAHFDIVILDNVRELRNLIERSLILGEFPPEFCDASDCGAPDAVDSLQAVERLHILTVLDACDGNRAEAARRLGVSRKTIDRKCAMWDA